MNKIFKFIVIFITLINFSCNDAEKIEAENFKQIIKIDSVSQNNHNILLMLDNLSNQLFYYDADSKCMFDFESDMPKNSGIVLPNFPYNMSISDDSEKVVILSASKELTIVTNNSFSKYEKDCNLEVIPYIEASYQLEELPDYALLEKSVGMSYKLTLIYYTIGKVETLNYNDGIFTILDTKKFNKEISSHFIFNSEFYFSFKNESKIIKLTDEEILFNGYDIGNIEKFIITEKNIFIFDNTNNTIMIYNKSTSSFEDIENNLNPLDSTSDSKKFKLQYPLSTMKIYQQEYVLQDGEKFNGTGYLDDNQLLEGEYLFFTDTAGYFSFITLSTDDKLITSYPDSENKDNSLEKYKTSLASRFMKFHTPLRDDYELKASSLLQSSYCTQFNNYDADVCFYDIQKDQENQIENYIKLSETAKNRGYRILGERFSFTYEGVIDDTTFNDGAFKAPNVFISTKLDIEAINIDARNLMIEILSTAPEDKKDNPNCPILKEDDVITLPIKSVDGHNITFDNTQYQNISSCFDQAFIFRLRVKDMFLLTASESSYYDVLSYCKTEEECAENNNFQNEIFEMKLFSYKEEIRRDATISFYLSEVENNIRYRNSIVSPIDSLFLKQDNENSKFGVYILDNFNNEVVKIDSNKWNIIERVIR